MPCPRSKRNTPDDRLPRIKFPGMRVEHEWLPGPLSPAQETLRESPGIKAKIASPGNGKVERAHANRRRRKLPQRSRVGGPSMQEAVGIGNAIAIMVNGIHA